MAAEIDMSNNRANMAFTGSREAIWHGLGEEVQEGATIEHWIEAAGLGWEVKASDVQYDVSLPDESLAFHKTFTDRKVLYRSDTFAPLSVVSTDFKIVQPKQVVEFFRDLVENNNMKLSTAGSLFGGKRFWALAELGKDFEVVSGDKVVGNLLLTTAVDGSLNTTARVVSTRVVCNNTLQLALRENTKNVVKVSHRCDWDPTKVKVEMGLIDEGWSKFISDMRRLASLSITDDFAKTYFQTVIRETSDKKEMTPAMQRKVDHLNLLYKTGTGSDMAYGTLWGALNAVTEKYTHGSGKRDPSHQFWDNFYGLGYEIKDKAYELALEAA